MADILYSYCLTLLGDNMDMQIVIPGAAFKKNAILRAHGI